MACIYKINEKTFNTTEEIQNYVSSDEFVSVLAKGNSGISKEVRNLILNKNEKTNEVREIEDGQNETKNEGIKSKGKNDGQKTNDVQNEEVTEGGVKAPQVTEPALRDVESTLTALGNLDIYWFDDFQNKFGEGIKSAKDVSEAYHKAKADDSNPELVEAVESLLSKEETKNKENAIQKPSTNEEVSRNGETRKNQPESSQGVRQGEQGQEATEKEITTVAEKASITPKNAKDLYKVNRELFGLNKVQALASAITMDRMVGAMAKRAGITKTEMYGRLKFEKATEQDLPQGVKFQVDAWHGSPYQFDKFQTAFMGKGEGAQAFGWGLYFTDLESIARNYAINLAPKEKYTFEGIDNIENISTHPMTKSFLKDMLKSNPNSREDAKNWVRNNSKGKSDKVITELMEFAKLLNIDNSIERNIYKVSLHKGKSPSEYTWLEWDKKIPKELEDKLTKAIWASQELTGREKETLTPLSSFDSGSGLYNAMAMYLGGQKQASEFLLDFGIDGIKYPAESISRGATSDNTRGFNYVVFDENAISIEEVIKFQKDANKARGAAMVSMDGQAVIYALSDPNVSTPLHELAHVFEHYLTDAEKLAVKNWAGTKQWDVQTSEKFARGFEKYLAEGKAPNSALEKVFANFKEWLTEIYNGIVGSDIDIELNDDMRELYSKMLGEDFSTQKQKATPQVKEANVKAIEEAMTKKSGTIKNEIIKEAADPTEVKKILNNLDAIKSKLAGLTTKDGDSVFSEECKWG